MSDNRDVVGVGQGRVKVQIVNTRGQNSCHQTVSFDPSADGLSPPHCAVAGSTLQVEARTSRAPVASARLMPSTTRRLANIRVLLAELSLREMTLDEIAQLLEASASAARTYVVELRDAGIVRAVYDRDGTYKACKPAYRLSHNPELSRAFVEGIVNGARDASVILRRGKTDQHGQITIGSGRRVHIMGDDVHDALRVDGKPVRRDPLVAALFGAAPVFY